MRGSGIEADDIDVKILEAGYATQIERVANVEGKLRFIRFANLFAVIRHASAGVCLFDTGYSSHFINKTRRIPELLYRLAVPVTIIDTDTAVVQLERDHGIKAEEVKYIFISHFHGDHYAGLMDFPNAVFVYPTESYEVRNACARCCHHVIHQVGVVSEPSPPPSSAL